MSLKETPEERRERLRYQELKRNPTSSLNDGLNRENNWNLNDITGDMGWKGTVLLILVLFIGYILYKLIF